MIGQWIGAGIGYFQNLLDGLGFSGRVTVYRFKAVYDQTEKFKIKTDW